MKSPYSLPDPELLAYADQHIKYEIEMLLWATATLSPLVPIRQQGPMAWTISNGLLNSYAIHARNLVDFMYLRSLRRDRSNDIIVQDYIDSAVLAKTLPPMTPRLKEAKAKADKQVAHLTHERTEYEHAGKEWHFVPIAADIMNALFKISGLFPTTKTSDAFRTLVSKSSLLLPEVTADLILTSAGQAIGAAFKTKLAGGRPG